jgi:hypothetical protein
LGTTFWELAQEAMLSSDAIGVRFGFSAALIFFYVLACLPGFVMLQDWFDASRTGSEPIIFQSVNFRWYLFLPVFLPVFFVYRSRMYILSCILGASYLYLMISNISLQ